MIIKQVKKATQNKMSGSFSHSRMRLCNNYKSYLLVFLCGKLLPVFVPAFVFSGAPA